MKSSITCVVITILYNCQPLNNTDTLTVTGGDGGMLGLTGPESPAQQKPMAMC